MFIEFGEWREKGYDDMIKMMMKMVKRIVRFGVKMKKRDYCNCIVATNLATYCSLFD